MRKYNKIPVFIYSLLVVICIFIFNQCIYDSYALINAEKDIIELQKENPTTFSDNSVLFHPLVKDKTVNEVNEMVHTALKSEFGEDFLGYVRMDSAFIIQNIGVAYAVPDYMLKEDYFNVIEGRMINPGNFSENSIEVVVVKMENTMLPMTLGENISLNFSDSVTNRIETINAEIVGIISPIYPFYSPIVPEFNIVVPDINKLFDINTYRDVYGDTFYTFNNQQTKSQALDILDDYGYSELQIQSNNDIMEVRLEEIKRAKPLRITLSVIRGAISLIIMCLLWIYILKRYNPLMPEKNDIIKAFAIPLITLILYYLLIFLCYLFFRLRYYPYNFWYGAFAFVIMECMNVVYFTQDTQKSEARNDKNN